MKKKSMLILLIYALVIGTLSGCGNTSQENTEATTPSVEVDTKATEETTKDAEEEAKTTEEANTEEVVEEDADTCYEAGRACLYGFDGQKIDLEAAYTNFEKALELGKTEANFYLGLLYDWYGYPEKDFEMAKTYYEAAGDNPYAQVSLGLLYYNGQGVEEDKEKGQELFDAVIAAGYVDGYLGSASIANDNEDYDTALENYNKVLESEERIYITSAMNNIAHMYYCGQGVEQNYAKAIEWYEKSADLGNTSAMNNLGYMYEDGTGVEQDFAKAMEWYEKSADLGNTSAMNNLGYMYQQGEGVEQDFAKAIEWYKKSADLGNVTAMNYLVYLYMNALGAE